VKQMNVVDVLGRNYVEGLYESEKSKEVETGFRIISEINKKLFEKIPYKVIFTEKDVYGSAKEMRERVTETGLIYIYTGWSGHPFLSQHDNNIGRAVHDVFAHMVCGCPFTFTGELNAYFEQRKYYPKNVWGILFAEIPMQTAAYYYTKGHDFPQRAIKATEQEMALVEHLKRDYSKNSVLQALKIS